MARWRKAHDHQTETLVSKTKEAQALLDWRSFFDISITQFVVIKHEFCAFSYD